MEYLNSLKRNGGRLFRLSYQPNPLIVDTLQIHWNRIEEYIWKWYPILQNSHGIAFG